MKKILAIIICFAHLFSCEFSNSELLALDYRQFKGTPQERLAMAVHYGDLKEIRHQVVDKGIDINGRAPKYGNTVLMTAVWDKNVEVTKCLLELGADPNIYEMNNAYNQGNAVTIASEYEIPIEILSLLMKYGGDPNSQIKPAVSRKLYLDAGFALGFAAQDETSEKLTILLDAGADINQIGGEFQTNALNYAVRLDKMENAYYLLNKGINFNLIAKNCIITDEGLGNLTLLALLRRSTLSLNSKQYQYKKKIIEFLKEKGLDYTQEPIPDAIVKKVQKEYPDTWEEYLKVY